MNIVIENNDHHRVDIEPPHSGVIDLQQWFRPTTENSVLLILNQEIALDKRIFKSVWSKYKFRACADGGANRLFNYVGKDTTYVPDLIVGDFDSVDEKVLGYYSQFSKVTIIKQRTQYSTDFMKCLQAITLVLNGFNLNLIDIDEYDGLETLSNSLEKSKVIDDVPLLVLNGIDGRFDQTVHSIMQFYRIMDEDPYYKLCYLTLTDIIISIPSGNPGYWLTFPNLVSSLGNCGLLPFGGDTIIYETRGLKWDLKNWGTSIRSGKVSSSNRFIGNNCYISCDIATVLSIEVKWSNLIEFLNEK